MDKLLYFAQQINLSPLPGSSTPDYTQGKVDIFINLIFGIFGAVALIIIVIAGFQYVLSQGDSQKVAKAKDTILYAVIGLVITLSAYSIVTFVVKKLT